MWHTGQLIKIPKLGKKFSDYPEFSQKTEDLELLGYLDRWFFRFR